MDRQCRTERRRSPMPPCSSAPLVLLSIVAGLVGSLVSGVGARRRRPHARHRVRHRARRAAGDRRLYRRRLCWCRPSAGRSRCCRRAPCPMPPQGAAWLAGRLPPQYRPSVPAAAGRRDPRRPIFCTCPPRAAPTRRVRDGTRRRAMPQALTPLPDDDRFEDDEIARGMRRLRHLEPFRRRRGHRARPARPAAPRPGSHRHRQLRRRRISTRIAAWAWSATISATHG